MSSFSYTPILSRWDFGERSALLTTCHDDTTDLPILFISLHGPVTHHICMQMELGGNGQNKFQPFVWWGLFYRYFYYCYIFWSLSALLVLVSFIFFWCFCAGFLNLRCMAFFVYSSLVSKLNPYSSFILPSYHSLSYFFLFDSCLFSWATFFVIFFSYGYT